LYVILFEFNAGSVFENQHYEMQITCFEGLGSITQYTAYSQAQGLIILDMLVVCLWEV
jgi:hypothetical protein